jgi:NhaC family Na+:H+ antiporter
MTEISERPVSLTLALIPVVILVSLLSINVLVFKDDALGGSNQLVLMIAAAITAAIGMSRGIRWVLIQDGIASSIRVAIPALLILMMVGALSGTWLVSGIVPSMIYYGLHLLNADIFLPAACIVAIVVSLCTGSSWTTSATVGIALMGIGKTLGLHEGLIAGAIISGAYFGDKMSPLSDTTNLAPAVAGSDLFSHIRYMMLTTLPSISIALLIYIGISIFATNNEQAVNTDEILIVLQQRFNISPLLMLVPAAVIVMIVRKVPALPAMFVGAALGGLFAFLFQHHIIYEIGSESASGATAYYIGIAQALFGDTAIATGNDVMDGLLSSGGMAGMLYTVWLILAAMCFGGAMEACGFLQRIAEAIISGVRSVFSLVASTVGTCIFLNFTASDQYLALVVPGRMFAQPYRERGLAPVNLSRTLEDSGTVTSVLVPWNTCGAYHAGVLGVATLSYAPFAFFCLISPFMTLLFAGFNIRIQRNEDAN